MVRKGDALDPVAGFEFMFANQADHPIARMCRVLGVSKSGYYCWLDRPPSARALDDEAMTEKIVSIRVRSRKTYGYRRIRDELVDAHDEHISKHGWRGS